MNYNELKFNTEITSTYRVFVDIICNEFFTLKFPQINFY